MNELKSFCCNAPVRIVHHYDNELNHYCPTGYVECTKCGTYEFTDEETCNKWNEK